MLGGGMIVSKQFNVKNYKRLRTKFSTQIADGLFNADEFIKDMKPFFDDRERKYKAYTSEKMRLTADLNQQQ